MLGLAALMIRKPANEESKISFHTQFERLDEMQQPLSATCGIQSDVELAMKFVNRLDVRASIHLIENSLTFLELRIGNPRDR
jgi:hypothetical protein